MDRMSSQRAVCSAVLCFARAPLHILIPFKQDPCQAALRHGTYSRLSGSKANGTQVTIQGLLCHTRCISAPACSLRYASSRFTRSLLI